jgi:carboxyl-terminal processing protease
MVDYPAVTAKMLPDQVGLIQVASLEGNRTQEVAAKVDELQKQGAKDLILDLRHCATGDPETGEKLANLFLDKGLITYSEGQKVERHDVTADPAADRSHLPLAVIVNRGTADGAEIAAAALLDDKRAEVVGERTYGDAAIRKAITMDDGSAVILSVAKYYSPAGKAIQDTGVTPSVPVQESEPVSVDDDGTPQTVEPPAPPAGEDLLLKKAIEVVTKGKSEVVSNTGDSKDSLPARTPLNIPKPSSAPPQ